MRSIIAEFAQIVTPITLLDIAKKGVLFSMEPRSSMLILSSRADSNLQKLEDWVRGCISLPALEMPKELQSIVPLIKNQL
jgi:hypothetical protein